MPDLLELSKSPSLFSHQCKVAKGNYEPCIEREEADSVRFACKGKIRKNIVTCSDDFIQEFIDEVNGIALDIELNSNIQHFPLYVPIFDRKLDIIPNLPQKFSFVGLSLKDCMSGGIAHKAGAIHEEKSVGMRSILLQAHCFKGKKVILFSSGPDTLIEHIWHKRDDVDFFNKVFSMGFFAATGFNFSLFVGECPLGQQLNMKKSLVSSYLYKQAGVLTIPHIYALNKFQVKRWCTWLKFNPTIQYFTVNCQLQASDKDVTHVIQSIKAIFSSIPYVHAILHGFPVDRIKDFGIDILRLHFAESLPYKKARNYRRMIFDSNTSKVSYIVDETVTMADLIINNFNERLRQITQIKNQMLNKLDIRVSA